MNQGKRLAEGAELHLLADEEFELGLDPRSGVYHQPVEGDEALLLTSRRVVRLGRDGGHRTVAAALLERVDAVEIRHVDRPPQRLYWSLVAVTVGIALAVLIWTVLDVPLLAVLVGGVIAAAGLWFLLSYVLDEEEGQLCFQAGEQRICLPLYTHEGTAGAYQVSNRFFQLAQPLKEAAVLLEEPGEKAASREEVKAGEAAPVGAPAPPGGDQTQAEQPDPRKALLDKLEAERARLLALVRPLPEEAAERVLPGPDLSVKQVLAHMAQSERAYVMEAVRGGRGDTPEVGQPPGGERYWTTAQNRVNKRPLNDILEELARTRETTLNAIQGIPDHALLTFRVRHRRMGELTLLQLLRANYRHDRIHADEVERAFPAPSSQQASGGTSLRKEVPPDPL